MHSKYKNLVMVITLFSITSTSGQTTTNNFDDVDSDVSTTEFPLPEDMSLFDQCNVNLTKICSRNGYCHYRLDLPLAAISDAYTSISTQSGDSDIRNIETTLQNQIVVSRENGLLLNRVSSKLEMIEQQLNKSMEDLKTPTVNHGAIESTRVPLTAIDFEETLTQNERLAAIETRMKSLENIINGKIARQQKVNTATTTTTSSVQLQGVIEKVEQAQSEIGNRLSNLEEAILSVLRGLDATISARIDTVSLACSNCPTDKSLDESSKNKNIVQATPPHTGENIEEEEMREEGPEMMLCKTCCEKVPFSEYMRSRDLSTSFDEDAIGSYNAEQYSVEAATGAREVILVEQRYREPLEYQPGNTVPTQIEETPVDSNTQNNNRSDPVQTGSQSGPIPTTPNTLIHEITLAQSNSTEEFDDFSGSHPGSAEYDVTTQTKHVTTTSPTIEPRIYVTKTDIPYDCAELYARGETQSGVYRIRPHKRGVWNVYCDMETSGGGWTTIQKRYRGNVNFTRNWEEYKQGFGDLDGDHWMGLEKMHHLSASNRSRRLVLRIDIVDWANVKRYAEYEVFRIRSEDRRYQLIAKKYTGTAGDALNYGENYNHHLQSFTTYDRDNDGYEMGNCGRYYRSGWWFNACFAANLNGQFFKGQYIGVQKGIYWGTWYRLSDPSTNSRYSFKYVDMKVRPVRFIKQSDKSRR